ncbi:C-myc promoter-binding protein [Schistosoma japonicum]|nr:C-myc promoter-binding protein [Schistosoma japonicum]
MDRNNLPGRLAEYFVICGLPKNPNTYDVSKIRTHAEEIIAPNASIDFTRFPEPIVDIKIVSLREKEEIPEGYTCMKYSISGKHRANILLNFGEEACICYRRGRDQSYVKDIDTLGEKQCPKTNAVVLSKTIGGRAADLQSSLTSRLFLSYLRGSTESSIDSLAVTDLCIIIPEKQESCPPAYRQVTEPVCISSFRLKAYICYRKSLVKQYIISYEPEVLYWYKVPNIDNNFRHRNTPNELSKEFIISNNSSDDSPMCNQSNEAVFDKSRPGFQSASQVTPLDPDIFQVANFCLPWGASIESWSVNQDPPEINSFAFMLTNESYQQLYGVALTFYEPYVEELDLHKCYCLGVDPELVSPKSRVGTAASREVDADEDAIAKRQRHFLVSRVGDRIIGVTKTLCILSRWSFTLPFSNFLGFLYSRCLLSSKSNNIPLERYLGYFLFEIPFPDRTVSSVSVDLCAAPILLQRPDDTNASSSCESFFRLLDNLSVDLIIHLFVQLLTEQKILMSSVRHSVLSDIGEALTCMIFPLKWTVVYIPYIYMGCIHVIQSPSPYLIGMDSRFFDFFRLPPNGGIAFLDLDTNNFKPPLSPGQQTFDPKVLPRKPLKQLKSRLFELKEKIFQMKNTRQISKIIPRNILLDCMFSSSNSEIAQDELIKVRQRTQIGLHIKEAFLQFMVHLLKDYRLCLIPVRNSQSDAMFNVEHFLRECADKHTIPFYRALFETQQWTNFVRDRIYASSRDEELDFFDNRIELLLESELKVHPQHHLPRSRNNISLAAISNLFTTHRSASSSHEKLVNRSCTAINDHSADRSLSSIPSVKDKSDESTDSQISSDLVLSNNNPCTIVVGPPSWPIPEFVDALQHEEQCLWTAEYSLGVVPIKLNSVLLDLLASRAFLLSSTLSQNPITSMFKANSDSSKSRITSATCIASAEREVMDNFVKLFPNSNNYTNMLSLSYLSNADCSELPVITNNLDHLDPHTIDATSTSTRMMTKLMLYNKFRFGSLMLADSPSPLLIRPNRCENASLLGLSTKYSLPVSNSTILKRTTQELRYTLNYCTDITQSDDYSKVRYLAGTAYSIWFMLLPAYLSSVYTYHTNQIGSVDHYTSEFVNIEYLTSTSLKSSSPNLNNDNSTNNNDNDNRINLTAMNIVKQILTQSLGVFKRMCNYEIEVPDQVALRILLVLFFQNRIDDFNLIQFINSIDWTSSSTGIVNHIYKTYEKELLEQERLEKERLKFSSFRHHCHRRSASVDTELNSSQMSNYRSSTSVVLPQPLTSSDDLTDLGYSTLNKHEDKPSLDQDWTDDKSKCNTCDNLIPSSVALTNHQIPVGSSSTYINQLAKCLRLVNHPKTGSTTYSAEHSEASTVDFTFENKISIGQNHYIPSKIENITTAFTTVAYDDEDNGCFNKNNSSSGSNLGDTSHTTTDDEDSDESEHQHNYGYSLLSSALSKIKRPFLHYNASTTTTPLSHASRPSLPFPPVTSHSFCSHHGSIDMNRNRKRISFSKSPRKSFDDTSLLDVVEQSIIHHGQVNHSSDSVHDYVDSNNSEGDNIQSKISVVHNALNFFNRSTSDFMNRINMNRSLLDWRSFIPSLSSNPTPQSGRRATTSSGFTSPSLSDQYEGYRVQQQQLYQAQSERISRVSWPKPYAEIKNPDSMYMQFSTNNIPLTSHKLSDHAHFINSTLFDANYYYDNYHRNGHLPVNRLPYINNMLSGVLSNCNHVHNPPTANHVNEFNRLKDMWINIAGPLLVGDVNRRMSPANTCTIHLQRKCNSCAFLSPVPLSSSTLYFNQSNSSYLIPTSNTIHHRLTVKNDKHSSNGLISLSPTLNKLSTPLECTIRNKLTTSIPITMAAKPSGPNELASIPNQLPTPVNSLPFSLPPSTLNVRSTLQSNNNDSESSPPSSSTSLSITTTTDSQLPNNNNHCITQLNIFITTCSTCPKCKHYVYDEEIMAGWSTDENDYRTFCPFCRFYFIPQLSLRIFGDTCNGVDGNADYSDSVKLQKHQQQSKEQQFCASTSHSSNNVSNVRNSNDDSVDLIKPQSSVPLQSTSMGLMESTFSYLSPYVIRKSLETIIQNEGDECLHCQSFQHSLLNRHAQLTWNLVWLIYRLGLPTHLLDSLPMWLINYQAEQRMKFKTTQKNPSHRHYHDQPQSHLYCINKQMKCNTSTIFTDALYVSLFSFIMVSIILLYVHIFEITTINYFKL